MCNNLNNKQIKIPKNIKVFIKNNINEIEISGEHGNIKLKFNDKVTMCKHSNYIIIQAKNNHEENKKYLGLYESLIKKNLKGVSQKYKLSLYLNGIGFKVNKIDDKLFFELGYSHSIVINVPKEIEVSIIKMVQLLIYSSDWKKLTQFASNIKGLKKIEPYKGKGILLKNENILRKEGKKNKK